MICKPCRDGADRVAGKLDNVVQRGVARRLHRKCKGNTWCDCQHKIPPMVESE